MASKFDGSKGQFLPFQNPRFTIDANNKVIAAAHHTKMCWSTSLFTLPTYENCTLKIGKQAPAATKTSYLKAQSCLISYCRLGVHY